MPSMVELLMEQVQLDHELLVANDRLGDDFSIPRDVEFVLRAPDAERAELVASFINDFRYGDAEARSDEDGHSVFVTINMAPEQPIILSVSGFMACLCELYGMKYDGWSSNLQRQPSILSDKGEGEDRASASPLHGHETSVR